MARDGLYFALPLVLLSLIFLWLFKQAGNFTYIYIFCALFVLATLVSLFFRDPERKIPEDNNLILSPADGKVQDIKTVDGRIVISIFLSVFNVHINRAPVAGVIKRAFYRKGKFLAAFREDASDVNERYELEIENRLGSIVVHQIAGVIARRVVCRVKEGQSLKLGERFGLIRFGSRVDLFLSENVTVVIAKGKKVKGGLTVMGKWQ
jgi:phosphatidylserine decarboxylase